MRRAIIAAAASVVACGTAYAQEIYVEPDIDDDDTYVEEPAYTDPPLVEEEVIPGPRVYGWQLIRPADCGTFRYWNGEYCADARYNPPED